MANTNTPNPSHLPPKLWEAECLDVQQRRTGTRPDTAEPPPGLVGLALSGGGIRSATLSLGVLQALAKLDLLRFVDYLSTVSGGGYAGTFLSGLYQRWKVSGAGPVPAQGATENRQADWERVRNALLDRQGHPIDWLRENGRYLAPNGAGDLSLAVAVVIRNMVAVHVVLGVTALALFLTINGLRRLATLGVEQAPKVAGWFNGLLVQSDFWWSPVLVLAAALFVAWVVPLGIAYWMVPGESDSSEQERPGQRNGAVRRNSLTLHLRSAMVVTAFVTVFGLLDSLGQTIFIKWEQGTLLAAFGALGTTLAGAAVVAQREAGALDKRGGRAPSISITLVAGLAALVLVGALLAGTSAVTHWFTWTHRSRVLELQLDDWRYFPALGVAWLLTYLFGSNYTFVNGSSLAALYGGRLARAYLGASNAERAEPGKKALSVQLEGDDLKLSHYRPHLHGGPLHLINVTVNETIGGRSQVEQRDRKGLGMAIGPAGVSVGARHHATWVVDPGTGLGSGMLLGTKEPDGPGSFRVFPPPKAIGPGQQPDPGALVMPHWPAVGRWMAISGAAVSTGLGSRTSLSLSLLIGLLNVRLGQWWRSGIDPAARTQASLSPSHLMRLLGRLASIFPVQAHLFNELLARFPGTSSRDWYLTDGGHFENSGAYELIRRRLPTIVVCDHGCDKDRHLEDLATLIRKVRIDFGAHVRFLDAGELAPLKGCGKDGPIGPLSELGFAEAEKADQKAADQRADRPRRYATLARISYDDSADTSMLLWLRPAVLGSEPADVLGYQALNKDFPQQSTADQFFDEAQWESYRRLGEALGTRVIGALALPDPKLGPAVGWQPFVVPPSGANPVRRV